MHQGEFQTSCIPTNLLPVSTARKASRMGGGGGGGGGSSRGYGGGGQREMFKATCSSCGGVAEVPFQPRGDKPVYCRDCFQKQRSAY